MVVVIVIVVVILVVIVAVVVVLVVVVVSFQKKIVCLFSYKIFFILFLKKCDVLTLFWSTMSTMVTRLSAKGPKAT